MLHCWQKVCVVQFFCLLGKNTILILWQFYDTYIQKDMGKIFRVYVRFYSILAHCFVIWENEFVRYCVSWMSLPIILTKFNCFNIVKGNFFFFDVTLANSILAWYSHSNQLFQNGIEWYSTMMAKTKAVPKFKNLYFLFYTCIRLLKKTQNIFFVNVIKGLYYYYCCYFY